MVCKNKNHINRVTFLFLKNMSCDECGCSMALLMLYAFSFFRQSDIVLAAILIKATATSRATNHGLKLSRQVSRAAITAKDTA